MSFNGEKCRFRFSMNVSAFLLTVEVSRLHSDTPRLVGILWASDQPVAQRPLPDNTQHSYQTDIHSPRRGSKPQSQQAGGLRPRSNRDRLSNRLRTPNPLFNTLRTGDADLRF